MNEPNIPAEPSEKGAGKEKPAEPSEKDAGEGAEIKFPALQKAEEMLKRMEEKEIQLKEREKALEAKIKEFDRAAAEMKMGGFARMRQEPTEEQKAIEEAKNLIRGTGFEEMAFPTK